MADGWAVEVTMQVVGGGQSRQIYYANIADRSAAEEAVKRFVSATPDMKVEATKIVPHNAFLGMQVSEGAVAEWL